VREHGREEPRHRQVKLLAPVVQALRTALSGFYGAVAGDELLVLERQCTPDRLRVRTLPAFLCCAELGGPDERPGQQPPVIPCPKLAVSDALGESLLRSSHYPSTTLRFRAKLALAWRGGGFRLSSKKTALFAGIV
jgi:hypothetical protein